MVKVGHYITRFESSNQKDQLAVHWYIPQEPKYLIHVVHGMVDHMGRYDTFGKWCMDHDILMVGFDVLGHGLSVKSPVYWGSFGSNHGVDTVIRDLSNFHHYLKSRYPWLPYFLLGHSMGSMWVRHFINTQDTSGLNGVVLSGTTNAPLALARTAKAMAMTIKKAKGPWAQSKVLEKMTLGNYNQHFQPSKTHLDWLSRDEDYVAKVAVDPASNFHFTTAGYVDLFTLMEAIAGSQAVAGIDVELPIYIFSGTKDYVGGENAISVRELIATYENADLEVTYHFYEDARHEPLNEINREEVYTDILNWMKAQ